LQPETRGQTERNIIEQEGSAGARGILCSSDGCHTRQPTPTPNSTVRAAYSSPVGSKARIFSNAGRLSNQLKSASKRFTCGRKFQGQRSIGFLKKRWRTRGFFTSRHSETDDTGGVPHEKQCGSASAASTAKCRFPSGARDWPQAALSCRSGYAGSWEQQVWTRAAVSMTTSL